MTRPWFKNLENYLSAHPDIEVVATVERQQSHVLSGIPGHLTNLMDVRMPGMDRFNHKGWRTLPNVRLLF